MGRKDRDVEMDFFSSHQLACFLMAFPSFLDCFQEYLPIVWKIMCLSEITRRHKDPFKPGSAFNMRSLSNSVGCINESKKSDGNLQKTQRKISQRRDS